MNAFELFPYHWAAGGIQVGDGCHFLTTQAEEEEVLEGVTKVGGDASKVTVGDLRGKKSIPGNTKGHRMVVDTFSAFCAEVGWDEALKQLEDIKTAFRKSGDNLLLTVAEPMHDAKEMLVLKTWADGVMELGFDRQGFGLYPFLKVTKMRGVPDSSRFLLFKETEKGLFMESTKRVF